MMAVMTPSDGLSQLSVPHLTHQRLWSLSCLAMLFQAVLILSAPQMSCLLKCFYALDPLHPVMSEEFSAQYRHMMDQRYRTRIHEGYISQVKGAYLRIVHKKPISYAKSFPKEMGN
nr:RecName: Full=Uncharacterized protein C7orf66 [Homo sapiens]EAL24381.1 hypothetical LOC154907 [Homo sapiens]|eukprot:NP_001019778.1 uncharacterized protein C7orf66 [Homo sapiens]